jgi:hypothetical protein
MIYIECISRNPSQQKTQFVAIIFFENNQELVESVTRLHFYHRKKYREYTQQMRKRAYLSLENNQSKIFTA